ncbi:MAG: peroxiredoxin family protein [Nitrospiraceae bacterium]
MTTLTTNLGAVHATVLVGCLLVVVGCDVGWTESSGGSQERVNTAFERVGLRVGDPAPNFKLWDLDENTVSLSQYRGKVVFLNFWATWCQPCRVEMPAMEKLYRDFQRKEFEVLAVSTDPQGVAVTRPFKDSYQLTFPILHDSDFRVGVSYGARTLPMTFLIDRQGVITHRIFGARDWDSREARQLIRTMISAGEMPKYD